MDGISEQDQGVTPSGPGCQPSASAASADAPASSQSGIPNALRVEIGRRVDAVKSAIIALGNLPLPREAQFRMGEMFADFVGIASGIVAATAGETEGLDERSEQSPVAKPDAQNPEVQS